MTPTTDPRRFLPLSALDFQVLTLLAGRELHGYAIVNASAELLPDQPALDIGSLYRIVARMLDDKLIREVKAPPDTPSDRRVRRFYTATALGLAVARAVANRLRALLRRAPALRLMETE